MPKVDPSVQEPIAELPHARGYRNGLLGEMKDAVGAMALTSPAIIAHHVWKQRKTAPIALETTMTRMVYKHMCTTALAWTILASISVSGVERRRFDMFKREPGWTQEKEDARDERTASVSTAVGALCGTAIGWTASGPDFRPNSKRLSAVLMRRMPFSLGCACLFGAAFNVVSRGLNGLSRWRIAKCLAKVAKNNNAASELAQCIRKDVIPVGSLPHALAWRNGFAGEVNDAGVTGVLASLLIATVERILKTHGRLPLSHHIHKAAVRCAVTSGGFAIIFAGVSASGKQYRVLVEGSDGDKSRTADLRNAGDVENLNLIGAFTTLGFGHLFSNSPGFLASLYGAVPLPPQTLRFSFVLGFGCMIAQLFNDINWIYHQSYKKEV